MSAYFYTMIYLLHKGNYQAKPYNVSHYDDRSDKLKRIMDDLEEETRFAVCHVLIMNI
ncbi:hypothetical protein [Bartonella tamiae]|uniref:Uncharacterized protein n=1 Tax=Bartonella tamiae Th239 TaxID=1094558 RepID=J1JWY9_9HYPH|nr:hypothetical protein [Bartonella tamiae]EJF89115.1 hypothetical protein ME5_01666 [Bartonella tamiae Th239]EJF95482.1 hypothetical protein MEG_00215 [Bartonella tamiae Th307]